MTKARDIADFKFENIVDTGTEGTRIATGTSAQRGSTAGQLRFNSDNNALEVRNNSSFIALESPVGLTSISPIGITPANNSGGGTQITLTGNNFKSGATVDFIGNDNTVYNATSVSFTNSTTLVATAPELDEAKEPYSVKVINPSGNSAQLDNQIQINTTPSWSTASGNLTTINDIATGTHATISATDPDGGDTITYTESTNVLSGAGLSLNSSTGAITGNPANVANSTTYTFSVNASDGVDTVNRTFNIIVNPVNDGTTTARKASSADAIYSLGINTDGMYYIDNNGSAVPVWCDFSTNSGYMLCYSAKVGSSSNLTGSATFGYATYTSGVSELSFSDTSPNPTIDAVNCRSVIRTNRAFRYLMIKWKGSSSGLTYYTSPPIYDFGSSSSNLLSRTGVSVSRLSGNTGRLPLSGCSGNSSYSVSTLYFNPVQSGGDRRCMYSNYTTDGSNQAGFFQTFRTGDTTSGSNNNCISGGCNDEAVYEIEIYIK